jgi:hypothetical protein
MKSQTTPLLQQREHCEAENFIPFCQLLGAFGKIAKSDCKLRHVRLPARPSARMEQLGSHWTDFYES